MPRGSEGGGVGGARGKRRGRSLRGAAGSWTGRSWAVETGATGGFERKPDTVGLVSRSLLCLPCGERAVRTGTSSGRGCGSSGCGGGRLTVLLHAGVQTLPQPAGWAVTPLGLADLTAPTKAAGEPRAFDSCSSVRDREAVRVGDSRERAAT